MSRKLDRKCVRCRTGKCPTIKAVDGWIHAGCRTKKEKRYALLGPFKTFKSNGRRNKSTAALHDEDERGFRHKGEISQADIDSPIKPEKTKGVGPQDWHEYALYFRHEEGLTVRKCAEECEVSFGAMQKFLNPESKRRAKKKQSEKQALKRRNDPEYAKKIRDYNRRYGQVMRAKKAGGS